MQLSLPRKLEATIGPAARAIVLSALDHFLPWSCAGCGSSATSLLCAECSSVVRWISDPLCSSCGLPLSSGPGRACGRCLAAPPEFRRCRALACYRTADEDADPLGSALRALKYGGRRGLAGPLSELLADRFPFDAADFDVLVPVPLHLDRLRGRGFNQAMLLARAPSRRFGLELDGLSLVRTRPTAAQVGLGEPERRQNLCGAFAIRAGRSVRGRRVLLLDDVCTSTATAAACARTLLSAGATSVDVLTVARTLPH